MALELIEHHILVAQNRGAYIPMNDMDDSDALSRDQALDPGQRPGSTRKK